MKKSNTAENNTNTVSEPATEVNDALTFDIVLDRVPAKEHRTFEESDFNAVVNMEFPATAAEVKEFARGLSANKLFCLSTKVGKTECTRVAKLFLESNMQLKPSAIASMKSVEKGTTEFWAGKLTYGLLSAVKNS